MLFTNPNIIQDMTDLVIGGVEVSGDKINYNEFRGEVYKRIFKMVVMQVSSSMSEGNSHIVAINETAETIYSYLHIPDKNFPLNEEQIVEEIMKSDEFVNWEANSYYNFLQIHIGVNTTNTSVDVGGEKQELKDAYSSAEEQDFFDLMQALASVFQK
jgi:hypothetical protein